MKQKIGILLLATHKYKQFVQPLIEDIKKYFLPTHEIEVHLFTDNLEPEYFGDERVSIIKELIPSYRFPLITLYRYKIFTSKQYPNCSHLFYFDIDMSICAIIGEEILADIVATLHPGFSCMGGGSWGNNKKSLSYTFPENRIKYYCGGFSGGSTEKYYSMMKQLKVNIDEDERNGVLAEWHDETHFNKYMSECKYFKELDSSYCMPEPMQLREAWKLTHLTPKILALDKKHDEIRK